MQHKLKTWPEYFHLVRNNLKKFEIRKNDRDFKIGDILELQEYHGDAFGYTGNTHLVQVVYVFKGGQFGLDKDYVCMSIENFYPQF